MTRQEFKQKIANKIIFMTKTSDAKNIESIRNAEFNELMIDYLQIHPYPTTKGQHDSQFIWIRRFAKYAIDQELKASKKLREIETTYSNFLKKEKIIKIEDLNTDELYEAYTFLTNLIDSHKRLIDLYQQRIMMLNQRLEYICEYYDKINIPFEEFVGLCGLNQVNAAKSIRDEGADEEDHKHYKWLFLGIEDAHEEEGWKSNRNGMPLQNLTFENFLFILDRNKKAKEQVDSYIMHDMGMAKHAVTLKTNADGTQTIEKYYPPLKALR